MLRVLVLVTAEAAGVADVHQGVVLGVIHPPHMHILEEQVALGAEHLLTCWSRCQVSYVSVPLLRYRPFTKM